MQNDHISATRGEAPALLKALIHFKHPQFVDYACSESNFAVATEDGGRKKRINKGKFYTRSTISSSTLAVQEGA